MRHIHLRCKISISLVFVSSNGGRKTPLFKPKCISVNRFCILMLRTCYLYYIILHWKSYQPDTHPSVFGLHWLLSEIPGSLVAKCSTVFNMVPAVAQGHRSEGLRFDPGPPWSTWRSVLGRDTEPVIAHDGSSISVWVCVRVVIAAVEQVVWISQCHTKHYIYKNIEILHYIHAKVKSLHIVLTQYWL